jgi:hypothetical protein
MNLAGAILSGLGRNSGLIQKVMEDPRELISLAGLSENELCALAGAGNALSLLLKRIRPSNGLARTVGAAPRVSLGYPRSSEVLPAEDHSVAITGIMSLLVVAGTVAALGTVSLAALARRNQDQTS